MYRAVAVYLAFYAAIACTAPYLAPYYRSLGLGLDQVGMLASFSACVGMFAGPSWGAIHDRFPHARWLIPLATVIAALGAVTLGVAGASVLIVLAVALISIGVSGTAPMIDVRALEIVGSDRSRYGLLRSWGSLSFFIAAPLVGGLVALRGPSGFLLAYVPALLFTALAVLWLPARGTATRTVGLFQAPGRVLTDRTLVLFLLGSLVAWTALNGQTAFMTIYLQQLGAPPEQIGLMMSVGALFEVPTMLLFPKLAARFGLEPLLVFGASVLVIRQLSGALITEPALLIAFTAVQGVGYALLLVGGVAFMSRHAPKGAAASAQGIFSSTSMGLASILGSGIGGQIANIIGLRGLFAVCAGLGAVAAVLIALVVLPAMFRERAALRVQPQSQVQPVLAPDRP